MNLRMRSVVSSHRILRSQESLSSRAVPLSLAILFEGEAKIYFTSVIRLSRRLQV